MISMYDLEDNLITIFDSYKECAEKEIDRLNNLNKQLRKENKRLNNIINGLEKYLIEMSDRSWDDNGAYDDVLDKLRKLKEE